MSRIRPPDHTIQLRGPWTALIDDSNGQRTVSLNIEGPTDWNSWFQGPGFSGRLVLQRRFNWTFPRQPPDLVELVVRGRLPEVILLNGEPIGILPANGGCTAVITERLGPSNLVSLQFDLVDFKDDHNLLESVSLIARG